jgi:DNA-directed RNA polymerase specialized sigma24 family protein
MDVGRTITREPFPTPASAEDVLEARHRDRRDRTRNRPATDAEMRDLPASVIGASFHRFSEQERDDLASEVRERIARRHGWHPPLWTLDRRQIIRAAQTLWRDNRNRIADVRDASAATDAIEDMSAPDAADRTDAAACWAGDDLPAAATDWREVCERVGIDPDAAEGVAVFAALSGYGTGAEIATVLGISQPTARKRLQRGREALAERWEDADALRDALADADAADAALADAPVMADGRIHPSGRWPINGDPVTVQRVRLDSTRRLIRRMLDRLASVDTLPHTASMDAEPRHTAPAPSIGPAAILRCQPERITVRTRRDYSPAGRPMDTPPVASGPIAGRVTPTTGGTADPDAAWIAATTPTARPPRFRPMTTAEQDAEIAASVNRAAMAANRTRRAWDRRRRAVSRLGGSTLL